MVAVVIMVDPQPLQRLTVLGVIQAMEGWAQVDDNIWLIATGQAVADVRDTLHATVPGGHFLVARLSGGWGTWGLQPTANWLRSVRGWF